jgi:hypothetical protein
MQQKEFSESAIAAGAAVTVKPHPALGFVLEIQTENGKTEVLERARGGPRMFLTLDAAIQTARRCGARSVTVPLT